MEIPLETEDYIRGSIDHSLGLPLSTSTLLHNYARSNYSEKSEDLISQLPDDILISIISRIPTKDVVRTSVLSRRWRKLCKFLPVYNIELGCLYLLKHALVNKFGIRTGISSLDRFLYNIELGIGRLFAQQDTHDSELIITSLDSFLRLHSSYKIHSFRLCCCLNKSVTSRFEQCISSLGRLGVEKFFLGCSCRSPVSPYTSDLPFSCHLFPKMPSLKCFELRRCSLQPSLRSQSNYSIQTIVLMLVKVSPGAVECILSDCLSLHSLTMTSCRCPPKLRFCGPHLELKSLYINLCEGAEEIELYASNLLVFEFSSHNMVNLIFDHVPQLQSLYLDIILKNNFPYVCGRLALDLPQLKSLNFVTTGLYGDNIQDMEINMFSNLRRLDIDIHHLPKIDLHLLTSVLQHCPLVREFHLNANLWRNGPQVEKQQQSVVYHSELKKMEITGFGGTEYEMEFALYVLKSAINLEKMHVSRCFSEYKGLFRDGSRSWCARDATPWSEEMEGMIHARLQGQAVSKIVQVIIQHNTF